MHAGASSPVGGAGLRGAEPGARGARPPGGRLSLVECAGPYHRQRPAGHIGPGMVAARGTALQRELELRDQRPYLEEYNTGAGGPANSPKPQGGIIIKK